MRRWGLYLMLAVFAVSAVGCGGQSASTPVANATPTPLRTLALATAWPNAKPRSLDIWHMPGGMAFIENAVSPDGRWAFGEATEANGARLGPAEVDRATGAMTILRRFTNPKAQVVSMAADDSWLAWVEGSLQPNFEDWSIYSYNLESHNILTLAAAPRPDGVHYPTTMYVAVSISHGVVVWSAADNYDGVYHVSVINADGTGGRAIASDARGPQIVWPWVMYEAKPTSNGVEDDLTRQNLTTGAIDHVKGPASLSYFAYDGNAVAWVSGDAKELDFMASLEATPVKLFTGKFLQFVSMNSRVIGWGEEGGAFAYDRKLNAVIQLSSLSDLYPTISAGAMDWLYQPDPAAKNPFDNTVERQLDMSQLPLR
jgi:hypothetical protein